MSLPILLEDPASVHTISARSPAQEAQRQEDAGPYRAQQMPPEPACGRGSSTSSPPRNADLGSSSAPSHGTRPRENRHGQSHLQLHTAGLAQWANRACVTAPPLSAKLRTSQAACCTAIGPKKHRRPAVRASNHGPKPGYSRRPVRKGETIRSRGPRWLAIFYSRRRRVGSSPASAVAVEGRKT